MREAFSFELLIGGGAIAIDIEGSGMKSWSASDLLILRYWFEDLSVRVGGDESFSDVFDVVMNTKGRVSILAIVAVHEQG